MNGKKGVRNMEIGNRYNVIMILILIALTAMSAVLSCIVVRRNPKTYWMFNHTLILYPYYYMIYIAVSLIAISNGINISVKAQEASLALVFMVNPVTVGALIADFVINAHCRVSPEKLATNRHITFR